MWHERRDQRAISSLDISADHRGVFDSLCCHHRFLRGTTHQQRHSLTNLATRRRRNRTVRCDESSMSSMYSHRSHSPRSEWVLEELLNVGHHVLAPGTLTQEPSWCYNVLHIFSNAISSNQSNHFNSFHLFWVCACKFPTRGFRCLYNSFSILFVFIFFWLYWIHCCGVWALGIWWLNQSL